MNKMYFPGLDEFYSKFSEAVRQSGREKDFLLKWGLDGLDDVYDILINNVQGGYDSHRQSMLSAPPGGSVLTIGPGMGFCVFLLSELYDTVFVAEPDGESCSLLKSISEHYRTHKKQKAGDIVKIHHAGLAISDEAAAYWQTKRQLMKKRNLKGSILNFDIKGAKELRDTFQEKVSRIYLHKVLSSFSIACGFGDIISQCKLFLDEKGVITWSEPGYIFTDILQVEPGDTLENTLKEIFEKNGMDFNITAYDAANYDGDTPLDEQWTLIKARLEKK